MRVVHPPFDSMNPYHALLRQALARQGVEVVVAPRSWSMAWTTWRCAATAVHLHWLHSYVERSRWWLVGRPLWLVLQLLALRVTGKRIVWTAHNLIGHERRHARSEARLARCVARVAHVIFVHSKAAVPRVAEACGVTRERIRVVPLGQFGTWYPNELSRDEARRRLGVGEDSTVLLFLGAIRGYKGVSELVEAFVALERPAAVLVIAGRPFDRELAERLRRRVAALPDVIFEPRFVPDDEVQVYMNAADAVVLPYRSVLTSAAAVLAMSFGRACIAPRLEYMAEILGDEGALLYDADAPAGLLGALRAAVDQRFRLAELGESNARRAAQWDWDGIARQTKMAYLGDTSDGSNGSAQGMA